MSHPATELTPLLTESTTEPKNSPTEDPNKALFSLYDQAIADERNKRIQLERDLEDARKPPPAKRDPAEFFADPEAQIEMIVARVLERQTKPINEQMARDRNIGNYNSLKAEAKDPVKFPKLTRFWPYIEGNLDKLAFDWIGQGKLIDGQWMTNSITFLVGQLAFSDVKVEDPKPDDPPAPRTPTNRSPMNPPNVHPDSPPAPRSTPEDPEKEAGEKLTEIQRRIARERGMSFVKYLELLAPGEFILDHTQRDKYRKDKAEGKI